MISNLKKNVLFDNNSQYFILTNSQWESQP